MKKPRVLLSDEPTSALDPELVGEVLRVMCYLAAEGRTMLIVTHEMASARDASNRILFLEEGRLDAQGEPQKLFAGGLSNFSVSSTGALPTSTSQPAGWCSLSEATHV